MAELIIRAGVQDGALMRRALGLDAAPRPPWLPDRIVVDAHVPLATSDIAATARHSGIPFLVDPQTHYLQDDQHAGFAWAKLPYATAPRMAPGALSSRAAVDRLVARCIDHQLSADATMIIAPYVHVDRLDSPWIEVQARLWHASRDYLSSQHISLDVLAVVALGWRMLHPIRGRAAYEPAARALADLGPIEVAVAASKADQGTRVEERLDDLLMLIERLGDRWPVIAWQQGGLGEACVAAGAIGYETGIGWREQCDLQASMTKHRQPPAAGSHPGARPVYVDCLKRSVPRRSLQQLRSHRDVWPRLICTEQRCCPPAGEGMLGDARQHAINSRARSLAALTQARTTLWRWAQIGDDTRNAIAIAKRINDLETPKPIAKIDTSVLRAVHVVAEDRRHRRPLRATA